MKISSFHPVGSSSPKILILGSMPGEASLNANQYYAHPRNAFWPIMGEIFGAHPHLPYEQRLDILSQHRLGLWDSLQSCVRPGSLDSAITDGVPNDVPDYLRSHPEVSHIFFNGGKALQTFRQYILPDLKALPVMEKLPSTSPAYAAMSFAMKLAAWQRVRQVVGPS